MKTAIFGGSFNPVHCGHIALAHEAVKIGYQRIIFVPANRSPFKTTDSGMNLSAEHRLKILRLTLEGIPWAMIWEGELNRPGPSYSIDSLRELQRIGLVSEKPGFIIGDDLVKKFPLWKDAASLAESTELLLGRRIQEGNTHVFPYPHREINNALWPLSSTQVRQLIARGKAVDSLLPRTVIEYINKKNLYGTPREYSS